METREEYGYCIRDEAAPHSNYTEIPNMVDDMDLTVYAYRLYGHLKRVAGSSGACWQSTETLAKACGMSEGMVSASKKELTNKNLIRIEKVKNERGGSDFHNITIVDIWQQNHQRYTKKTDTGSCGEGAGSPDEPAGSWSEPAGSCGETINNPINKNPINNGEGKKTPSRTSPRLEFRTQVQTHFEAITCLPHPEYKNQKQVKECQRLWWSPLDEIGQLVAFDPEKGKRIVEVSVSRLSGLTITDPNSILKTARSVYAELFNGGGAQNGNGHRYAEEY